VRHFVVLRIPVTHCAQNVHFVVRPKSVSSLLPPSWMASLSFYDSPLSVLSYVFPVLLVLVQITEFVHPHELVKKAKPVATLNPSSSSGLGTSTGTGRGTDRDTKTVTEDSSTPQGTKTESTSIDDHDRSFDTNQVDAAYVRKVLFRRFVLFSLVTIWYGWDRFSSSLCFSPPSLLDWICFSVGLFGFYLRDSAKRSLGRFFTFEVGIRSGHRYITTGPYQYLLHPSYTGLYLLSYGLSFYLRSWICFVWETQMIVAMLIFRIPNEEKVLEREFGDVFRKRKQKIARLIPYVY